MIKIKPNAIDEQTINEVNFENLKVLFPHAVSLDEAGRYVIDPQKLQMSLDPALANIREDGYGLNWVGKKEAYHHAFSKNYKVLKPLNDANSKNWETTGNVLIKGDNLDALKILRHNYFESIKMIYIDPPYNTKNDGFVYNDNFTCNTEETLETLGYDKEYIDYIQNIHGAKTHSGWLSFMYPRLLLSRDLLKDDGVIFISIDDNEVAQLRLLCDEVFGEENFINEFIWKSGRTSSAIYTNEHEYILCYAKNKELLEFISYSGDNSYITDRCIKPISKKNPVVNIRFKKGIRFEGENKIFENKLGDKETLEIIEGVLECKDGILANDVTISAGWTMKDMIESWMEGETVIDSKGQKVLEFYFKSNGILQYIKERGTTHPKTIIDGYTTKQGTNEVTSLLKIKAFEFPKPYKLIQFLMLLSGKNDLILDFFAGSGTTAHAVMDLNATDGGNRKFILVQWVEETPPKSEARKAGYGTVFDITCERIKRAGEKIIGGDLTRQELDIGFRTFEVVEDAKQCIYQKSLEEVTQEDLLAFTCKADIGSNEEILYNLLVAEALPLSAKIEVLVADKLYLCENVAFVLCDLPTDELIAQLKSKKACEYVTVYSPNIADDTFSLELEGALSSMGIKSDKLRFRG